jgi:hypothetical protein
LYSKKISISRSWIQELHWYYHLSFYNLFYLSVILFYL